MSIIFKLGLSFLIVVIAGLLIVALAFAFSLGTRLQNLAMWGIAVLGLGAIVVLWVGAPPTLWLIVALVVVVAVVFFMVGGGF
jgi:hypothetical protein